MRYEVYTINGLHGVKKSLKAAYALADDLPANTQGKFGILVKVRKNAYAHAGVSRYRFTMLTYPKGAVCTQYTPDEWLAEVLA